MLQTKTDEKKKFANKYGYFTEDGREYVITRPDTPRPWVNVLSNGDYGFVVSQTGSGFSWRGNSNLSRITRWEQDLIKDEWGKYVYARDKETGEFWSLGWKPCMADFDYYEVRHGLGYSVLKSSYKGIASEMTMFLDKEEPIEVWKITLKNESEKDREISLISYFEWCLGNANDTHREFQKTFIETKVDEKNNAIYGKKRPALVPGFISTGMSETPLEAFHAVNVKPSGYEGDKEHFFGMYGGIKAPGSVEEGKLSGTYGKWYDSIASLMADVKLAPGEEKTVIFVLGATRSRERTEKLIKEYSDVKNVDESLEKVKNFWIGLVEDCQIDTPDDALNIMTNVWLKYQAISARMWAKCAYYQSSGGIGFRDQLQDSNIWLPLDPSMTKKQIMLHAEQQFVDGTVHHWWHPGTSMGAKTHMTDDLLWLVFITMNYIDETADYSILDEKANFLPDAEGKVTRGTLYEHCMKAIEKVFSRWSPRGLPLIGEGDWNDGMSHVGIHWKGESVWLGHFLYGILQRFIPMIEKKKDGKKAEDYRKRAADLKDAINKHAWDGSWYIRATRDDGRPLGSSKCEEGKIFLNAQTWSVICGTATEERGKTAMDSCEKILFREYGPLLFNPGYSVTDPTIGYLSRYAPSVRENGGVYTHAATWAVQASCMLGRGKVAHSAYSSMCSILRGMEPDHYYAEPYVTPGNVDGPDSPNFGRGGWTWYSGSGAWMFKVALDWMTGVRSTQEGLVVDPVIPSEWDSFKVKRKFRGATFDIEVKNPDHVENGVKSVKVDGKEISGNVIPPQNDKKTHSVEVIMG